MVGQTRLTSVITGLLVAVAIGAYVFVLIAATHLPPDLLPFPPGEAVPHFISYAGLTLLVMLGIVIAVPSAMDTRPSTAPRLVGGMLIVIACGALLDEITQPLSGRTFQWTDWGADMAGVVCVILLVEVLQLARQTVRRMRRDKRETTTCD